MTDAEIIKRLDRIITTKSKVKALINQSFDRMHELEIEIHLLMEDLRKNKKLEKKRKKK